MTIIAACKDTDGTIWMGADCITLHRNYDVKAGTSSKIFRLGEILVGASGTVRSSQIVSHLVDLPAIPPDCHVLSWLIREFSQVLRAAMKTHGGETKGQDGCDQMDARIILGLRGTIYEVGVCYDILAYPSRYAAIGCADQEAQAAMFTALALRPDMHARAVVQCGLDAAAEFDLNIRPPFEILCSEAVESVLDLRLAS